MSWQTTDPRHRSTTPATSGPVVTEALFLLATLGRKGWSCLPVQLARSALPDVPGNPASAPLAWLRAEGLIQEEVLVWHTDRSVPILRLTAEGKNHLRQQHKPVIRSEIETLQDRYGHALKPHYGQSILFAALARQAGYTTQLCVTVPTRTVTADIRLTRRDTHVWVSIESGLERPLHPLDHWHRLAQIQAFLPLVAPTLEQQREVEEQAKARIYMMYSTNLSYLLARLPQRHACLWNRRYNRFEEQATRWVRPRGKPDWETWVAGHAAMLRYRHTVHSDRT